MGVRLAYAAGGLPPSGRIVWCGGPFEIAGQLAAADPADAIGANAKVEVFNHVRDRVGTFAEIFWKELVARACVKPSACLTVLCSRINCRVTMIRPDLVG
ncbi:MAG: hypothetical protein AB7G08_29065 [Hyphomicrobiaceae bacterium]